MCRMSQRLSFLNFLIKQGQWLLLLIPTTRIVIMRWLLLVKRSHAEFLVYKSLMLSAAWSVAIVCIVSKSWLVQVAKLRHHSIDAA